jgi:transcription initiation factor TFIID subunit 7
MVVLKLNLSSLPKHPTFSSTPTAPSSASQQQPRSSSSLGGLPVPRIRVKSTASASTKIRIRTQKDVGLGYDSEASDREDDPAIEEQIILRCRPGEDAEYLRACLAKKEIPDVMIKFKGTVPLVVGMEVNW